MKCLVFISIMPGWCVYRDRVDDRTRSMLCNGSVNISAHMDNIEKQLNFCKQRSKIRDQQPFEHLFNNY